MPARKTVTIISNNLAGGGVLSCVSLGRALSSHYSVQIIGSKFGSDLWMGVRNIELDVDVFPGGPLPGYVVHTMRRMVACIRGDIVIAHQMRLTSFGTGLWNKVKTRTPCALYIDDDDLALTMPGRANRWRDRLRTANGDLPTRLMYRLRRWADVVFCGSEYYSAKLGGITVPLGRDARMYDPVSQNRDEVRRRLGICQGQFVIGFMGNPRPHIGIEDLVRGLEEINDRDCILLVIPPGDANEFTRNLLRRTNANIRVIENQASTKVPAYLAASDVVAVPQRAGTVSNGQLPARLVEAMAMAKPIITTELSDIPELLGDGGLYIPERSPGEIATALRWIREHPREASEMGRKARGRFLRRLTLEAMAERLVPTLDRLIGHRRKR